MDMLLRDMENTDLWDCILISRNYGAFLWDSRCLHRTVVTSLWWSEHFFRGMPWYQDHGCHFWGGGFLLRTESHVETKEFPLWEVSLSNFGPDLVGGTCINGPMLLSHLVGRWMPILFSRNLLQWTNGFFSLWWWLHFLTKKLDASCVGVNALNKQG